ncbi:MAG: PH domain-containing protein [Actinomycetota bacterium]
MPWPEDALSDDEHVIVSFRQHWKLLIIPIGWFVLGVILLWFVIWLFPWAWAEWFFSLVVIGGGIWLVGRPVVDWLVTLYVLTNERLITRRGLIAKSGVELPLERITNVNFSQTMLERMLAGGDLLVESAGATGQSEFSNIPRPDEFAKVLYKAREERTLALQGRVVERTATAAAAPKKDPTEQLQRLKQLHDDGILTDEEYAAKRQKLVDEI